MKKFRTFSGPHQVTRTIDDKRVATRLDRRTCHMGRRGDNLQQGRWPYKPVPPRKPCSGALLPAKSGWVQLTRAPNLNATADHDGITIETKGDDVTFRIVFNGIVASSISAKQWDLPGISIRVQSDGGFSSSPADNSEDQHFVDVTYNGVSRIRLQLRDSGR